MQNQLLRNTQKLHINYPSMTIIQAEKVSSNSSLYSDRKNVKFKQKNVKLTKQAHG